MSRAEKIRDLIVHFHLAHPRPQGALTVEPLWYCKYAICRGFQEYFWEPLTETLKDYQPLSRPDVNLGRDPKSARPEE